MLLAETDWTTIALAAIGLAGSIVSAWVMIRVKAIEAKAAHDARRSEHAAQRAEDSTAGLVLPRKRKKKKPPGDAPG